MIESELIQANERSKYLGYRSTVSEIKKVIVPVILGAYITLTSYQIAAILILIFSVAKFILSFFIENKNINSNKINLNKFIKEVKSNNKYPIKKIYAVEFLKGITVNGALDLVVSLLIIYAFKTELNLGIWTSIFSICIIIVMMFYAKFYNKKKTKMLLNICGISII